MSFINKTLSFSKENKGWVSFYSYIPENIIGMNSAMYTFSGGNLYKHDTNSTHNNFYGTQYTSKLKGAINKDPYNNKLYRTVIIDGNKAWDCTLSTNLSSGYMSKDYFEEKEGVFYSYIRRTSDNTDTRLRSAQGIGSVTTVDSSTASAVTMTFTFDTGGIISVGDVAYKNNAGAIQKLGDITAVSTDGLTVTIDTTVSGGSVPVNNDYILYIKNSVAESYGATGYYLDFDLESNETNSIELFSISSMASKSFV